MNYDFSTLNDKEFEEISKYLLNSEYKLGLRSSPSGRDQGIDLRKSTIANKNEIVVQVKHYINSTVSSLKNSLVKNELPKVQLIKPTRYIVVTSLPLTHNHKDFIVNAMQPFILTPDDIFSQQDLNDLLVKHPKIEKQFYKLWLSSIPVLQQILNNAVESRSRYFLERVSKKMKYYVSTTTINLANEILKEEKILMITGEPGVGKTTLAEILIFNRARWDYKIHVVEDLIEAEDLISYDDNEKQLFYFDDFLGSNYTEIINSHRTETRLTNFVERIYNAPNKYIILTTRSVILNIAVDTYEKISRSKLNVGKFILSVGDYDKYDKALILYNHLYFNEIPDKFFKVILKDKFYFDIIEHDSYRPRIIEFITDIFKIKSFTSQQYKQFILNNLNNPENIWSYSFHNQINYFDRCLLLTLYTYENFCDEKVLSKIFQARLENEKIHNNQILENNQYAKSLKMLSDGFITIQSINYSNGITKNVSFINPSLTDFLINYVNGSIQEKTAIFNSFIFSKQIHRFNQQQQQVFLEDCLQSIIKYKISEFQLLDLKEINNENCVKTLFILMNFCQDIDVDDLSLLNISQLNFALDWNYETSTKVITFINKFNETAHPDTFAYLKLNFIKFIIKILNSIESDLYATDIVESFEKYDYDYNAFKKTDDGITNIHAFINNSILSAEEDSKGWLEDEVDMMEQVDEEFLSLNSTRKDLLDIFEINHSEKIYTPQIDKQYWQTKIEYNEERRNIKNAEKDLYEYESDKKSKIITKNQDALIEKLFVR